MDNTATRLAELIAEQGGTAYYVGGTVRDMLIGREVKDIDIEVFGLNRDKLESILSTFGDVNLVGKAFGVYKVGDLDIALPRTETKIGVGHTAFAVTPNPHLSIEAAMRRRDFTMNAVYQNVLTGEIVDYFGGVTDINNATIRIVDRFTFLDDSLRVLRASQFASRLGFTVDASDIEFMNGVDLSDLPAERVWVEMEKLLMGDFVVHGLEVLDATGAIRQLFPELDILRTIPQDEFWHPEGDVWTHTKMVMGIANLVVGDLTKAERLTVMLACLFHDLGKATTTELIDGRVRAHGHSEAGVPLAFDVLSRLNVFTIDGFDVRGNVLTLVEKHLIPAQLHKSAEVKDSVFRRLATKVNVKLLSLVCRADVLGRGGEVDDDCVMWFNQRIAGLDLTDNKVKPILLGRHLIEMGMSPSATFGIILNEVFEKQLDGSVTNLDEAKDAVREYLNA
jgi:tRNA nucleotidyltransferase (CCA-adding enzyme)